MTYVAILNKPGVTISTDELIVSPDDVSHVDSVAQLGKHLSQFLSSYKDVLSAETKRGYDEGFEKGKEEGLRHAREQFSSQLTQLSTQHAREKSQLADYAVSLALQIVRRIAEDVGPAEMMAEIARTASREFSHETQVVLRVHPDNAETVRNRVQNIYVNATDFQGQDRRKAGAAAKTEQVEVRADDSLGLYDCLLETEFGTTIASLEHQLTCLEDVLLQQIRGVISQAEINAASSEIQSS